MNFKSLFLWGGISGALIILGACSSDKSVPGSGGNGGGNGSMKISRPDSSKPSDAPPSILSGAFGGKSSGKSTDAPVPTTAPTGPGEKNIWVGSIQGEAEGFAGNKTTTRIFLKILEKLVDNKTVCSFVDAQEHGHLPIYFRDADKPEEKMPAALQKALGWSQISEPPAAPSFQLDIRLSRKGDKLVFGTLWRPRTAAVKGKGCIGFVEVCVRTEGNGANTKCKNDSEWRALTGESTIKAFFFKPDFVQLGKFMTEKDLKYFDLKTLTANLNYLSDDADRIPLDKGETIDFEK